MEQRGHEVKVLEVRDRATLLVLVATKLTPSKLLTWAGCSPGEDYVFVTVLNEKMECGASQYAFAHPRTRVAVQHIIQNFGTLQDRDVVDIEYILGEVGAPKVSQWPK